jgi:hypothetical protein
VVLQILTLSVVVLVVVLVADLLVKEFSIRGLMAVVAMAGVLVAPHQAWLM